MTSYLVVGTAGHVDHGKTALVRALTGTDTDRLKEEKERGISIALGFASLKWKGRIFAFVDVPGHEKFVKTMAAGAWGVDIALLVVACDEGVMPQTREHLDILQLLGVRELIVVLSKCDLAGETLRGQNLEAVERELASRPFRFSTLFFSAKTEEGKVALLSQLEQVAERISPRRGGSVFRLPVDRAFSLKGVGAVVTGTIRSGSVEAEDLLWLMPERRKVTVRTVEQHGERRKRVAAGERAALHLSGVTKEQLRRGQVVCGEPTPLSTREFLSKITLLSHSPVEITRGTRFHLHHHTALTTALLSPLSAPAIKPGEEGVVRVRTQYPLAPVVGDRLLLRRISPLVTVGGGWVLDPAPDRRAPKEGGLAGVDPEDAAGWLKSKLEQAGFLAVVLAGALLGETAPVVEQIAQAAGLAVAEGFILHPVFMGEKRKGLEEKVRAFHEQFPLKLGVPKAELVQKLGLPLQLAEILLRQTESLMEEEGMVRLKTFTSVVSQSQHGLMARILRKAMAAGLQGVSLEELGGGDPHAREIIQLLKRRGEIHFGPDKIVYSAQAVRRAKERVAQFLQQHPSLTIQQGKELLGLSRRHAVALLELLDQEGFTVRRGEGRVLRRKPPGR